jgi:hypothetical protein
VLQLYASSFTRLATSIDPFFFPLSQLHRLIALCCFLYCMRNYSELVCIHASMQRAEIHRLRLTWRTAMESQPHLRAWDLIDSICTPASGWVVMRTIEQRSGTPTIPYIGLHLTDLTFVYEGNNFASPDPGVRARARAAWSKHLLAVRSLLLRYPQPPTVEMPALSSSSATELLDSSALLRRLKSSVPVYDHPHEQSLQLEPRQNY